MRCERPHHGRRFGCFLLLALGITAGGCGGNPYSYAREYLPHSGEDDFLEQAVPLTYEEVRRDPRGHSGRLVSWFGTVEDVGPQQGDQTLVALELRFQQPRPLCRDQFESSCRVTVSDRTGGPFSVRLALAPEQRGGRDGLGQGALVRVYGYPVEEFDERGGPILRAAYFRYWPHGTFVFASNRHNMRR